MPEFSKPFSGLTSFFVFKQIILQISVSLGSSATEGPHSTQMMSWLSPTHGNAHPRLTWGAGRLSRQGSSRVPPDPKLVHLPLADSNGAACCWRKPVLGSAPSPWALAGTAAVVKRV